MLLYIRDLVFDPLTSAWTADSAYSTLMGNSAVLNTDQESESVCDELVGDELMGDLHRSEAVSYTHLTLPTIYSV